MGTLKKSYDDFTKHKSIQKYVTKVDIIRANH